MIASQALLQRVGSAMGVLFFYGSEGITTASQPEAAAASVSRLCLLPLKEMQVLRVVAVGPLDKNVRPP